MNMQALSMADSDHYEDPWQQSDWIGDQILRFKYVFRSGSFVLSSLQDNKCTWIFNPPDASHVDGPS